MSILFINGPAGSGKDVISNYITTVNKDFYTKIHSKKSFKDPLFKLMFNFFNIRISLEDFLETYYTRELKEVPTDLLTIGNIKLSPRQALIHISENVMKPSFGKNVFGELLLPSLKDFENYVFSDSGFLEEMIPLARKHDCYLARISRHGTNFNNDSRKYIDVKSAIHNGINYLGDFENNSSIEDVSHKILQSFTLLSRSKENDKLVLSNYNSEMFKKFDL